MSINDSLYASGSEPGCCPHPQGIIINVWGLFFVVTTACVYLCYCPLAGGPPTTNNYLAQNISTAEAEKPCFTLNPWILKACN